MAATLAERWWIYAIRGVAGIAFGILTFISPQSSLLGLLILFGAWAVINGAFALSVAARRPSGAPRWPALIFEGIASIVAGVLTLVLPGMSALVLVMVIAAWAVVTGISAIASAIRLRKQIRREWLLALSGLLSVALGVLLFIHPAAGALAMVFWIGAYAIVFGGVLLVLAFRLRAWGRAPERRVPTGGGLHVPA